AARIDAEIRVQAIFGGDSRLHVCGVTFAPRLLDGFVRDAGEDAWMAIERAADAPAGAHFGQHHGDHFAIALGPRFPFAIARLQAAHVGMHLGEPQLDDAIGRRREHDVGALDVAATERREVRAQRHADADAHQAPGGPATVHQAVLQALPRRTRAAIPGAR